jgi:Calx-beta domain
MAPLMDPRRTGIVLSLALLTGLLVAGPAEAACAAAPPRISLSGFTVTEGPRAFYLGVEGSNTTVTVVLSGGCNSLMSVKYATSPGTATSGQDYTPTSATVSDFVAGDDSVPKPVSVAILPGGDPEPVVESLTFSLSDPQAPGQGTPTVFNNPGTILVVDSDGASRAGFEGVPYSQSETFPTARIPVFWAGPSPGSSPVTYTIEPGPTNPATPGEDFTGPTSGSVNFSGNRWATIDLGIVNDKLGEGPEDVTITLSGGAVASPSSTTFTIEDNEENVFPTSRFHHPRHKWRYKKSDYRIREFHIFASDNSGGSGVVAAELALRRNLRGGKCAWKAKKGWQKKDCDNRTWLPTKYDEVGQLFYYRMQQLKSSVNTRIKDYTAFSRAIDGAGNVEKDFAQKRNANTFEIKRSKPKR